MRFYKFKVGTYEYYINKPECFYFTTLINTVPYLQTTFRYIHYMA